MKKKIKIGTGRDLIYDASLCSALVASGTGSATVVNTENPVDRLKEALSSKSAFEKYYLVSSEVHICFLEIWFALLKTDMDFKFSLKKLWAL